MDDNPIYEAMLAYWGERCPDHHKECVCCQAWEQYDKTSAQPVQDATMQSLKDLKRSVCDEVGKAAFAQPAQEPVEDVVEYFADGTRTVRIAPQRPWVYLTDEELLQLSNKWRIIYGGHVDDFAKEIEAKLKEKNNG